MPCSSFPPQPNSPTQMVCYTTLRTGCYAYRGQTFQPRFPQEQHAPNCLSPVCGPEVLSQGSRSVMKARKALEYDLTQCLTLSSQDTEGPFVRYSISKAMSKVVVFQGRAVPSHLCYTFRITSRLCLESSSTGSSFPANCAKPVPLAVVSLDSR